MQDVFRFWLDRGVDGFRDRRDRPAAQGPAAARRPARHRAVRAAAARGRGAAGAHATRATRRTSARRSAQIREAAGDAFLVGEVYLPSARWRPTSTHFDAAFAFELLHAPWEAEPLRGGDRGEHAPPGRAPGCCPTTTSARLADALRRGERARRRAAAADAAGPGVPLPGRRDRAGATGPPGEPRYDRAGRDRYRHPMQWDGSPSGGFTTGDALAAARRPGASATSRTSATIPARCWRSCAS